MSRRKRDTVGSWRTVYPGRVYQRRLGFLTLTATLNPHFAGWHWDVSVGGKWSRTIVARSGDLIEDLLPTAVAAKRGAEDGARSLIAPAALALPLLVGGDGGTR